MRHAAGLSSQHGVPQVFGNSPDETANCRLSLNKETTQEATVMIQPSLFSYGLGEAQPISEPVRLLLSNFTCLSNKLA